MAGSSPERPAADGEERGKRAAEKEAHGDETVPVVAAVIERDGAYLVALRPHRKRHGGFWEFPGGKVADGESDADALRRELAEELGVTVEGVGPTLFTGRDGNTPFSIRFRSVEVRGDPTAHEHDEIRWIPGARLPDLRLAPVDRDFVARILDPGLAGEKPPTYLAGMPGQERDPDRGPRLPRPSRARFPGWLLPLLGGVAGGFVAGWWGAAFGAVVGFLVWRTRA